MLTPSNIIDLWPSSAELARRIGKKPVVIQRWKMRNRIPGEYDRILVERAKLDEIPLSFEDLAIARSHASDQRGHTDARIQAEMSSAKSDRGEHATNTKGAA